MHRSYLYAPGDRPERLRTALGSGTDAVIADLEDGVAPAAKDAARAAVCELLAELAGTAATGGAGGAGAGPEVLVRVNTGERHTDDLTAVVLAGARAVYLPKADLSSLTATANLLDSLEAGAGLAAGAVAIVALIETARGLGEVEQMALHPRVRNFALGEADLTADLGISPTGADHALWPLRMRVVVASAAAGLDPPTAPVFTAFRDLAALEEQTALFARAGFGARSAIHPDQVPVINEAFSPTDEQVAAAARLVELFDVAVASGAGVCVDDRGAMVDEAVVRTARRTLARARRSTA